MDVMTQDELPGRDRPRVLRATDGVRHHVCGQIAVIKNGNATNGELELSCLSGPDGASVGSHVHHTGHEAILVLEGSLDLAMDGTVARLESGDYASIPPGTTHAYRMHGASTEVAQWTLGGRAGRFLEALATASEHPLPEDTDTQWRDASSGSRGSLGRGLPDSVVPYVLRRGEGEHLAAGLQVFTFLSHQRATGGRFITVATEGRTDERTPLHLHEHHSETFLCLEGGMTMWVDGERHGLGPGDFVHVPPGTVHAYCLHSPGSRFVGVLVPGLFEPFFRTLCEPWPSAEPPRFPLPFHFDRVLTAADPLDVRFLEPPPAERR
jgi:quercetin 2,3-dioxygenase